MMCKTVRAFRRFSSNNGFAIFFESFKRLDLVGGSDIVLKMKGGSENG